MKRERGGNRVRANRFVANRAGGLVRSLRIVSPGLRASSRSKRRLDAIRGYSGSDDISRSGQSSSLASSGPGEGR